MKTFLIAILIFIFCINGAIFKSVKPLVDPADPLDIDGVWIRWNTSKISIPFNAVYGGFDVDGIYFIIKADHSNENGIYIGKIIGKYNPIRKIAFIGYGTKEYTKVNFEILTHTNYIWTEKFEEGPLIPGSNGNNICRFDIEREEKVIPGRLDSDGRFCTVTYKGSEVFSPGFQLLKRNCVGRRKIVKQGMNSGPQIMTIKELNANFEAFNDALHEDGVWVYWDVTKDGIPPNAVYGGYDEYGPYFVIMADHTNHQGIYVGKYIGKYNPLLRACFIDYDGEMHTKTHFEILTHKNYVWTNQNDTRPLIPGTEGNNLCRFNATNDDFMTPGRLHPDGKKCTITYYLDVKTSETFETLRRIC